MTRGKYAARATVRRIESDAEATATTHLRTIATLTSERDHLTDLLREERRERAHETRVLRAQRDEVLAPELAARDHVIGELRDEIARQRARFDRIQVKHDKLLGFMIEQRKLDGRGIDDAIDDVAELVDGNSGRLVPHDMPVERARKLSPAQLETIAVKDGLRRRERGSGGDVRDADREHLAELTAIDRERQARIAAETAGIT